jgi:hypothetical protein
MPPAETSGSRMDAYRLAEVGGWLRWKPGHPPTIGPGKAEQTKRHGGWADGDGMTSRAEPAVAHKPNPQVSAWA